MYFLSQDNDLNFINKIQSLYFYAPWMPYHKKMMIMIDKIEKKYTNIEFTAIDVDFFKNLCKRFEIKSIPTILIFYNGKELKRINGLILTSAFKSVFVDICESIGEYNE